MRCNWQPGVVATRKDAELAGATKAHGCWRCGALTRRGVQGRTLARDGAALRGNLLTLRSARRTAASEGRGRSRGV